MSKTCPRCDRDRSLPGTLLLCYHCGYVPVSRLEDVVSICPDFNSWSIEELSEEAVVFTTEWLDGEWEFQLVHDEWVGDWMVMAKATDGSGCYQPGGVPSREDAIAYVLDLLDVVEDSQVTPKEPIT